MHSHFFINVDEFGGGADGTHVTIRRFLIPNSTEPFGRLSSEFLPVDHQSRTTCPRTPYRHNLRKQTPCKPLTAGIKMLGDWIQFKRQQKGLSSYHLYG